ncbi:hypothetical protein KUV89_00175 [Marinobacter hydrocarbonoclasticus]|nr:hypothetical protein [Marinobacter nauticus]
MMIATALNVLGLVMVLVEQGGNGVWVLLAGLTLTAIPWLRQLVGVPSKRGTPLN